MSTITKESFTFQNRKKNFPRYLGNLRSWTDTKGN